MDHGSMDVVAIMKIDLQVGSRSTFNKSFVAGKGFAMICILAGAVTDLNS